MNVSMNKYARQLAHDKEIFNGLFWKLIEQYKIVVSSRERQKIRKKVDEWFSPRNADEYEIAGPGQFMERFDYIYAEIAGLFVDKGTREIKPTGERILDLLEAHKKAFQEYQLIQWQEQHEGRFDHRS